MYNGTSVCIGSVLYCCLPVTFGSFYCGYVLLSPDIMCSFPLCCASLAFPLLLQNGKPLSFPLPAAYDQVQSYFTHLWYLHVIQMHKLQIIQILLC